MRLCIWLTVRFLAFALACGTSHAQPYPARPVRLVLGFAPGGAADFVSRTLQEPLAVAVHPSVGVSTLRALAVTSRERTPLVPGIPGMSEAGLPDYELSFWYGFFVPAGTPRQIVSKIFDATASALALPAIGRALEKEGTETSGSKSPEDFAAFIAEDTKLWARLVRDSGAKAD